MAETEVLEAFEGMMKADELNEIAHHEPEKFAEALRQASETRTYELQINEDRPPLITNVAAIWATDHAASLTALPHATLIANAVMGDRETFKKIDDKARFYLCEALFDSFELVPGWRGIAEVAGLTRHHIVLFLMRKLTRISNQEIASPEDEAFLDMLLSRPGKPQVAYGPILTDEQCAIILEVTKRLAPRVFQRRRAETIAWRIRVDISIKKKWHETE